MSEEREILETILKGNVWSFGVFGQDFTFKSYIYQRKVFLKLVYPTGKLLHLGSVEHDGQLNLNKKFIHTRRREITLLKQFFHEMHYMGFTRDWLFRLVDEQVRAELYESQEEMKQESDWLDRLGL